MQFDENAVAEGEDADGKISGLSDIGVERYEDAGMLCSSSRLIQNLGTNV